MLVLKGGNKLSEMRLRGDFLLFLRFSILLWSFGMLGVKFNIDVF